MLCGVFHEVAGQGEDEKKLRPYLGSADFLSFGSSPVGYENLDAKIQQHFLFLMVISGTPHEPKSISSNCQQPKHTAGALCGFLNSRPNSHREFH